MCLLVMLLLFMIHRLTLLLIMMLCSMPVPVPYNQPIKQWLLLLLCSISFLLYSITFRTSTTYNKPHRSLPPPPPPPRLLLLLYFSQIRMTGVLIFLERYQLIIPLLLFFMILYNEMWYRCQQYNTNYGMYHLFLILLSNSLSFRLCWLILLLLLYFWFKS